MDPRIKSLCNGSVRCDKARPHGTVANVDAEAVLLRVGRRIRALRKAAGLTQEELAERIDANVTHLGAIERGRHNPSLMLLARIADALKVSLATVVDLEEEQNARELRAEAGRRAKAASETELRRLLKILDVLRG